MRLPTFGIQQLFGVHSALNQTEDLGGLEVLDGHDLGLAFCELSTEGGIEH